MTDRYAVVGNPIGHSKSPVIHQAFAEETGQDISYVAIESPLGGFAATVGAFRRVGGRGLNITAPFKLDARAYATELTERARMAGAVNAMKFEGERVFGDNYDGVGLVNDIERNLGFAMREKRILVLGAGGAARGAILPFLEREPASLTVANRNLAKVETLVNKFSPYGRLRAIGYEQLASTPPFDLVVNATSASWHGELPPIPESSFSKSGLAYELVYGKGLTPFLRLAHSSGCGRLADGVGMLVEQAAEAFAWWRGVRPETAPLIARLTIPLV